MLSYTIVLVSLVHYRGGTEAFEIGCNGCRASCNVASSDGIWAVKMFSTCIVLYRALSMSLWTFRLAPN